MAKVKSDKVWVKCVVDTKPWTSEKPLAFGEKYEVSRADAELMEGLNQVVILEAPEQIKDEVI